MAHKHIGHQQNMEMNSFGPPRRGLQGSRDDIALTRLGKKPILKRNFGYITILGFSCTVLITWEAAVTYFSPLLFVRNSGRFGS